MRNVQSKFNYSDKLFEDELFTVRQKTWQIVKFANQQYILKIPFKTFNIIRNNQQTAVLNLSLLILY